MRRLLILFLSLALLSAAAIWLANNPGDMVVHWRGYEIRTSFMAALVAALALAFLCVFVYRVAMTFLHSPAGFSAFLDTRRKRKGYQALSRGMVAIAAGDARDAKIYAGQAHRLLDDPALTLLLAAQAAQLEGDNEAASRYFQTMLETPDTEFIGLRGLYIQAMRDGDRVTAEQFARRAFAMRPQTQWAADAVFRIETMGSDWVAAEATLDKMLSARLIDRPQARRWRAVLLTARALDVDLDAKILEGAEAAEARVRARDLAFEAARLDGTLVPAVALAGRLAGDAGRVRKAAKLIESAWESVPHPDLAIAYARLREGETSFDRLNRIRHLVERNPNHPESRMLLAQAAIEARDWDTARNILAPLEDDHPTVRVCELLADIEDGQYGNRGRAREWLSRALHAPRDPMWVCGSYHAPVWAPVCPECGAFDAMVWRSPDPMLPAVVKSGEAGVPAGQQALAKQPGEEEKPAVAVAAGDGGPQTGAEGGARPAKVGEQFGEPVIFTPPRAPDDPGTDNPADERAEGGVPKW